MTYALLSMSERHGLLAGIMCAGASPVPACAELTQPPAWFFAAVARPCLWAVGVQLPPHLAASASCCVTWRSCFGGSLRRRRPACRGSLASELLSRRGPCRRPGRKSTTAGGTTAKMASCFLICRVFFKAELELAFEGIDDVKKNACARARQQHSGVSGECSLPSATGEHCLLAMPLRERVRPVVSGDAKPTEPQSGAMAPRSGWGAGALKRAGRAC